MNDHTEKLKALGDETRLRIVRILLKADTQLCVCEIESITGKPQYAISRALGVLRNARLVREERDGKLVKYGILAENEFSRKLLDSVGSIKCADVPAFSADVKNIRKVIGSRDSEGKPSIWCGC
jgi:ArsR family transcriptional regulator, arsenate/arsenite/antimonite-responsive transcriptional repressor